MPATKEERLREFLRRVTAAEVPATDQGARKLLADVMNAVEDEMSGIDFDPQAAEGVGPTDGRMYPPSDRFEAARPAPGVRLFRHVRHRTYVGANGSIRIVQSNGLTILERAGADGRTIEELLTEVTP